MGRWTLKKKPGIVKSSNQNRHDLTKLERDPREHARYHEGLDTQKEFFPRKNTKGKPKTHKGIIRTLKRGGCEGPISAPDEDQRK